MSPLIGPNPACGFEWRAYKSGLGEAQALIAFAQRGLDAFVSQNLQSQLMMLCALSAHPVPTVPRAIFGRRTH